MPEMFFFAAEENVLPWSNLTGMTVCGDGQCALQHIDEDVAVERAPLVQEAAGAYHMKIRSGFVCATRLRMCP